jgi:molybdopterin synthase catalytic subunit
MIAIVDTPIDANTLVGHVRTDACGAVVTFLGVVRETSAEDVRPVQEIAYEAYSAMAVPEMEKIAQEARERFGPIEISILHRTGNLGLGEASVGIAVAAPHRAAAFDACEYAIDALKARVAIWKQERFRDGDRAWRANTLSGHK